MDRNNVIYVLDTIILIDCAARFNIYEFLFFPDKADSCTINSVTFLKQLEVITVNSTGQLKIFDLRQTSDDPVRTFSV